MHPLTLKIKRQTEVCFPGLNEHSIEPIVQSWAEERAEWLKKKELRLHTDEYINEMIDQAFQLEPETLEEKFKAIRLKHDGQYHSAEDFWDAVLKEFTETAAEHYGKNNAGSITPKTVHGLCSSSQTEAIYK